MKPPFRASAHSTSRTLVTLAEICRPITSKVTTSPTSIPNCSLRLSSIETSGSDEWLSGQKRALEDALVVLEMVSIRKGVLAAEPVLLAHFLVRPET